MIRRLLAGVVALVSCAALPVWSQMEPSEPPPPPDVPVEVPLEPAAPPPPPPVMEPALPPPPAQARPNQGGGNVRQVLSNIAQQFRVQMVVDPLLQGRVNPPNQARDIQAALEAVTRQLQGVTWRKVYLRADMQMPESETLVQWVRTLATMEAQGLILADATGSRITSYVRNVTVPPGFEQQLDQMSPAFRTRPVYVVFYQRVPETGRQATRPRGSASRAEDLLALEQERMQLFMQLPPEERQRAIRMGVQMFMNMDPSVRMQLIQEGIQWFMNLSPEERQRLFEQGAQMFQQMMGGPR